MKPNTDNTPPPLPGNWRDKIDQNVAPRTTPISQKRHNYAMLKLTASIILVFLCVIGGYLIYTTWHNNPSDIKAPVKTQPLKTIVLRTDGVLNQAWVVPALALPKNVDMMELDLDALRARLLANPQIRAAVLTRQLPGTLAITLEERAPVARIIVRRSAAAKPEELLAARDGALYAGTGYKPATLSALPWLADVPLRRAAPGSAAFAPVDGMATVADLISTARANIPDLYAKWRFISLKRFAEDHVLIVNNADNSQVIFGLNDDFYTQVARLSWIMDHLDASAPPGHGPVRAIDLSVGQTASGSVQVPVTFVNTPPQLMAPPPEKTR